VSVVRRPGTGYRRSGRVRSEMRRMGLPSSPASLCFCLLVVVLAAPPSSLLPVSAEDPYRFYTWNITFGDIYPLGVKQEARLCSRSDCFHCCDK
jgi:hypothetical protein